jgi:2'-hydroxyisoflavone reductase
MSVYADPSRPGLDEAAPVATLADPATEDIVPNYGALKAACEAAVVRAVGPARAALVRPGLIVGPFDATDRFGYWVARFLLPDLLGERGEAAVVPAPPSRPVQFVEARNLAQWLVSLAARRVGGAFNACSDAGRWTMGALVDTLVECAARRSRTVRPCWVDDEALLAAGVVPWTGLPLWIPRSDPESAGFLEFDCRKAHAAGLAERPLAAIVDDTADWLAGRDNEGAWRNVLPAAQERAIALAAAG